MNDEKTSPEDIEKPHLEDCDEVFHMICSLGISFLFMYHFRLANQVRGWHVNGYKMAGALAESTNTHIM